MSTDRDFAAVILAAGKGTRMKSALHKVMHPIAGKPMLGHLLDSVDRLGPAKTVVVVGSGREQVEPLVAAHGGSVVVQEPQLGTAHAVQQAQGVLAGFDGDVLILYGDTPFVTVSTMQRMRDRLHAADAPAAVVVASRPADPRHYGRILAEADGTILKMVEYRDASEAERAVDLCNSGLMAVRAADLWTLLARVDNGNAAGEYYLPDIVMIAAADGRASAAIEVPAGEVEGINSLAELAEAEAQWQAQRRRHAMDEGATLVAPETVWFAWDTELGRDVFIEPNVIFESGVAVGDGVRIEPNLTIVENSRIPPNSVVTMDNRLSFRQPSAVSSATWTGRFRPSDRARMIVELGPTVLYNLSAVIKELEQRAHNLPPEIVEAEDYSQILSNLKLLQARLNELVLAIERGQSHSGHWEDVAAFYKESVAPWLRERLSDAARSVNDIVSLSPALIFTYLGLTQIFDSKEFTAFIAGAIGGVLGGGLQRRGVADKE